MLAYYLSIQLTKIARSVSLFTQMMMILFPLWAGDKNDKIKVKMSNIKKLKWLDCPN